jgi:Flp pilus assembly protein TadG
MMRCIVSRASDTVRRLFACQRGGPAIEMAIILPVLSMIIIGTVYAGWMIYSTTMLNYAVESAARCVAVATAGSVNCGGNSVPAQSTSTQTYAASQALGVNVTAGDFTVTQLPNGCGWQVSVTYQFTFLLPSQAGSPTYTITPSACFPIQSL